MTCYLLSHVSRIGHSKPICSVETVHLDLLMYDNIFSTSNFFFKFQFVRVIVCRPFLHTIYVAFFVGRLSKRRCYATIVRMLALVAMCTCTLGCVGTR